MREDRRLDNKSYIRVVDGYITLTEEQMKFLGLRQSDLGRYQILLDTDSLEDDKDNA